MSIIAQIVRKRVRGFIWCGTLSYRRMHITYESRKMLCPLCQHELEPVRYFGSQVFQKNPSKSDYVSSFWIALREDGELVWSPAPDLVKSCNDW